jgi:hypothetical protein
MLKFVMANNLKSWFNGAQSGDFFKNRGVENTYATLALTIVDTKNATREIMFGEKAQVAASLRNLIEGRETNLTDSDEIVLLGSKNVSIAKGKVSAIIIASGDEIKFEVPPTNGHVTTSVLSRCEDVADLAKLEVLGRMTIADFKVRYLKHIVLPEPLPPAA